MAERHAWAREGAPEMRRAMSEVLEIAGVGKPSARDRKRLRIRTLDLVRAASQLFDSMNLHDRTLDLRAAEENREAWAALSRLFDRLEEER